MVVQQFLDSGADVIGVTEVRNSCGVVSQGDELLQALRQADPESDWQRSAGCTTSQVFWKGNRFVAEAQGRGPTVLWSWEWVVLDDGHGTRFIMASDHWNPGAGAITSRMHSANNGVSTLRQLESTYGAPAILGVDTNDFAAGLYRPTQFMTESGFNAIEAGIPNPDGWGRVPSWHSWNSSKNDRKNGVTGWPLAGQELNQWIDQLFVSSKVSTFGGGVRFYDPESDSVPPIYAYGSDHLMMYVDVDFSTAGNYKGPTRDGWTGSAAGWRYFKSGGYATGWISTNGTWYYLDPSQYGFMFTGWKSSGSTWYYLQPSGAMATGWSCIANTWYFFDSSGAMKTGWQLVGGNWYYMNPSGAMATGWQLVDGKWYYMNSSGTMATGWIKVGNHWYYMDPSGAMITGWKVISGKWYYMDPSGKVVTGIQIINGKLNRFKPSGEWVG